MAAMSEVTTRYAKLADSFEQKLAAVDAAAWSNPSPCDGWDARGVVSHVLDVHTNMCNLVERERTAAPSVDEDPAAAFAAARADLEAVLADPAQADHEYDGAFGRTTVANTIDMFLCFDLAVHNWDLARATGLDETIDPVEVERVWAAAHTFGPAIRSEGICGPEVAVAEDAPLQDRLIGYLGRQP